MTRASPAGSAGRVRRDRDLAPGQRASHGAQLLVGGGLVTGDLDDIGRGQVHVEAGRLGPRRRLARRTGHRDRHGVEEVGRPGRVPGCGERVGQPGRLLVDAAGDRGQPVRPVVGGVHRGDDREQDLRRADVAGRLLAADVLLAGLEGEPVGGLAVGIDRDTDQAAGQLALEAVLDADVARVRAAEAHRHAEALGGSDRDVRAQLPGRGQQRQPEQVGGDDRPRAPGLGGRDRRAQVADRPAGARVLQQHAEELALRLRRDQILGHVGDDQLDAQRLGPSREHRERLRQAVGISQEHAALAGRAARQRHPLGRRAGLVQHRGAGDRQRGQVLDHGLEIEQRLEPALRDLRLVGRVRGVPGRVLEQVAPDDRGRDRPVVAEADHRGGDRVLAGQSAQLGQDLVLGERLREAQRPVGGQALGQCGAGQLVQGRVADGFEHAGLVGVIRTDVTLSEFHWEPPGTCGDVLPLCRPPPRAPEMRAPGRSWCLRGSGEVAPSAPRLAVRGLSRLARLAVRAYPRWRGSAGRAGPSPGGRHQPRSRR